MRRLDFLNFGLRPNPRNLKRRLIAAFLQCDEIGLAEKEPDIYRLIDHYLLTWKNRKHARHFFGSGWIRDEIRQAYEGKASIVERSGHSEIHSVVLILIGEYEVYLSQWAETRKLIKKQRRISNERKNYFFDLVANRDGLRCKSCGSDDDLKLDHIKAVSHGGLSELENFQLLCFSCNSQKGKKEKFAIYGWWTTQLDNSHRLASESQTKKRQR